LGRDGAYGPPSALLGDKCKNSGFRPLFLIKYKEKGEKMENIFHVIDFKKSSAKKFSFDDKIKKKYATYVGSIEPAGNADFLLYILDKKIDFAGHDVLLEENGNAYEVLEIKDREMHEFKYRDGSLHLRTIPVVLKLI
jgi:hypothetical protein